MTREETLFIKQPSLGTVPLGPCNVPGALDRLVCPCAHIAALWMAVFFWRGSIQAPYVMLSLLVFALTFPGNPRLHPKPLTLVFDVLFNWLWVALLLTLVGYSTGYLQNFPRVVLLTWLWLAPLTDLGASVLLRTAAPALQKLQGPGPRAIVVGMNGQGLALANKLSTSPYARTDFLGFVDGRSAERLGDKHFRLLGTLEGLHAVMQRNNVQVIYLSLPMTSQPRILQVLDSLKDTTASIYFVPDMFVTDLIQGHVTTVCGTPVISVCESPFRGLNGVIKRGSDVVFSLLILALISPLLLLIALAVKWTSPGQVIFRQRRYGLDGEEIVVYKFRSMTVTEDGAQVAQAQRQDARITPLGAFLRRTSLDELPQFINVLQGRMSIVGPRPHAVAHNEFYRKLIKGYMVRHKVKPGITGWAQVNGFRGETETLDKMQGRIDFDLDYLRNWSLQLDTRIILRTIRLMLKDHQAY
ncbi:MAG: undecaprenyl-phosphate glucose phosphotransferase [Rhodoferax sp.]|nr:undecaprenyl-phosphate glucose phosphotransferase [Rhodoferax sp.]